MFVIFSVLWRDERQNSVFNGVSVSGYNVQSPLRGFK